jgi:hypothetical protein
VDADPGAVQLEVVTGSRTESGASNAGYLDMPAGVTHEEWVSYSRFAASARSRIANVEVEAGPIVSGLSFEVDREESPEKAGDFGRRVIPSSHHHGCDPLYSCGRLPMARFAERLSAVHDRSALQSSARRRGSFLQAFARFLGVEEGKTRGGGRFVIAGLVVPAISNRKA